MKILPVESWLFQGDRRTNIQTDRYDGTEMSSMCNRKVDIEFCLQVIIKLYLHE